MDSPYLPLLATVVGGAIATVASIVTQVVSSRLASTRERRLIVWRKEVDRFFELEQLAGDLVEELGGYQPIAEDCSNLAIRFSAFESSAGHFGRYPKVRQAIRDLHNVLGRMLYAKGGHADDREIRKELEPSFRALLDACDEVVEREKQ